MLGVEWVPHLSAVSTPQVIIVQFNLAAMILPWKRPPIDGTVIGNDGRHSGLRLELRRS
jgi:hypothetical protein